MFGLRDVFVVSDPHSINNSNAVGVIPLLTAVPRLDDGDLFNHRRRCGGIQIWQNQLKNDSIQIRNQKFVEQTTSYTSSCQDCGNQAKKDCVHRRCRSCCKGRGFDCVTHVKSTWVPAARRRERQLMAAGAAVVVSSSGVKKPKLIHSETTTTSHTSTSNTPPRSSDNSSRQLQDGSLKDRLPGELRAMATFKCVRVTAVDDGEDEYAYQAMVKIGGHLFKGFLYDQGVATRDEFPHISELHLGGGDGSVGYGVRNGDSSSSPVIDPSHVYATSGGGGGGFIGGSGYGNPIN